MTVNHDHFARARQRTKEHEQVLSALPREAFGSDGEDLRTMRAQSRQSLRQTTAFKLRA